jgi:hypothetical protein
MYSKEIRNEIYLIRILSRDNLEAESGEFCTGFVDFVHRPEF